MPRPNRMHGGPPRSLVYGAAAATTLVVLLAYGELAFEVARLHKPWGPFVLRCVIIGVFWGVMLRGYLNAARVSMRTTRWWWFLLGLLVLVGSMAVAVIYRLFVNVQAW